MDITDYLCSVSTLPYMQTKRPNRIRRPSQPRMGPNRVRTSGRAVSNPQPTSQMHSSHMSDPPRA
ncbi:hypothetical protein PDIG_87810 [Penicillium digitatum PHI26]|uniref:Uncharacterized protein n=2 Tax=Penicillium digitatum TaxID=36651 RepID=K9FUD0_PEND2|nr:hypothetical protein PDIP_33830 [Penicillium digitatum Pd1]EKV04696.1 hypothetical protein PDIG_87810 [Penicillium digitatum PHI26]EKV16795.1 hypothetical protein PDIP_33830 [Penicillium digitatum Pd1]